MHQANPTIQCKKCELTFEPDVKSRGVWLCPGCQTKNPNLKRHYRSVADLCVLGLIFTLIIVILGFINAGPNLVSLLAGGHAILLLVTIVFVYKSKTPWADRVVKTLIWVVFAVALTSNVVIPLVLAGRLNLPALLIYAVVFPYLFWLNSQARKCTVSVPPALAATMKPPMDAKTS